MTDIFEVWSYQGGGSQADDYIYGVAAATDNSVFLAGSQEFFNGNDSDFAVVKLDADGDLIWEWQEGSEGEDILFSVEPVGDGVVGCGFFSGTWNGVTTLGGEDFAVVKLFSNGTVAWRWQNGTDGDDYLEAAAETADGNIMVAGYAPGSWADSNDIWYEVTVVKLDVDNGEVIWTYQNGTAGDGDVYARAAAARGDGSVVVGGHTYGSFAKDFTGDSGAADFIAVAIDEDGTELWRWQDGPGVGFSSVRGVATFDDGSILLVGTTEGNWSGDSFGARDFAVSKLSAYGDLEWWWQSGTEDDEEFEGVSKAIDGYVVMSGYTYGNWSAMNAGGMDFVATSMNANADRPWEYQAGTTSDDDFNNVAVRPDGAIVLGGWTRGTWTIPQETDEYADFAAVLLANDTSTTPSTSAPTYSTTSFPTPFPAPSPTPSPTDSLTSPPSHYLTPLPTSFQTPSPSTSSPLTSIDGSTSGAPVGFIVGGSIGGVVVIAVLIACCFCFWRSSKKSKPSTPTALPPLPAERGHVSNITVAHDIARPPPPLYTDPPPSYSAVA